MHFYAKKARKGLFGVHRRKHQRHEINHTTHTKHTMYTIHCQYDDNGTLVTETTTTNSRREALRLCEQELKWENTISAFATDIAGDLVE